MEKLRHQFPGSGAGGLLPFRTPARPTENEPTIVFDEHFNEIHAALLEIAPEPILVTDDQGRIIELNPQAERQFGYRRKELLHESMEKLIPERFWKSHREFREAYRAKPFPSAMENRADLYAVRKDGREFPVQVSLWPVETGNKMLFYSIVRDASELTAARQVAGKLQLEQSLAGLSARLINLPANQVDQEIACGFEILAKALDVDRATLGIIDPHSGDIIITIAWARPGFPVFPDQILRGQLPWLEERIRKGEHSIIHQSADLPLEALRERNYMDSIGEKSSLIMPFHVAGKVTGAMQISSFRRSIHWDEELVARLRDVADMFANALARKQADEELQQALGQIQELKDKLERENDYLREEVELVNPHTAVVGNSPAMRSVLKNAEQVAGTDSAVLILGETGTGKELIAQTIHSLSRRKDRPMVRINCASLPATLIESELFGREKGAYTGALAREIGRFEVADKSTIFLDEIGELPLELQPKLLRVLQEGDLERLGSSRTIRVDVRIIAATNRDLHALVNEGKFREDLFYRLNVFPILIPPLRDRLEDLPALTWHILKDLGKRMGRNINGVHSSTFREFQKYAWPGNIRELRNVIERSLILHDGPMFRAELPHQDSDHGKGLRRLAEVEIEYFQQVLKKTLWRVRGHGGAAEVLGLKPTTLEARLKKLGVLRPK